MSRHTVGTWMGHPKGVFLIAFTELWERFSYFGMTGLLTLYLTADVVNGGWGWSRRDAVVFYGFYAGLVFIVPVIGAWIANNYLGERRCIVMGAMLLTVGHLLLGGPAFMPPLIERLTQLDAEAVLVASNVALGRIWALDEISPRLLAAAAGMASAQGTVPDLYRAALWTYVAKSTTFLLGLSCIVIATGLFKSTIVSIVGKLYPAADARRDAGYAVLFTCIYLGAVLANFTAGGLGERLGWHYGFGAAAAGMTVALAVYFWKEKQYLGDLGLLPDRVTSATVSTAPLTLEERDRLRVIICQGVFTTLYAAAFFQKGGLLTLYTRDHVDRTLFGHELPATWFLSVSILVFMVVTPLLAVAYMKLGRRGLNPSASYKLGAGLFVIGIAYALIASAETLRLANGSTTIDAGWLVTMYVLFGISDALVWPNQIALASKLSPQRYAALIVGAWHLTVGIGTWLTGLIGAAAEQAGHDRIFQGLALLCLVAGAAVTLLTPLMKRRMHGAERTDVRDPPSPESIRMNARVQA